MGNNVPPPVKKSKSKKSKKAAAEWEFDESDYLQKLMGALEQVCTLQNCHLRSPF